MKTISTTARTPSDERLERRLGALRGIAAALVDRLEAEEDLERSGLIADDMVGCTDEIVAIKAMLKKKAADRAA